MDSDIRERTALRKFNSDNKGMTLVEVIVSLMILTIVVIPMISSFVTATKANKSTKDTIYANTAGENVMEAVKVLGIEETAREFNDCGRREFSVVPAGSALNHYEVSGGDQSIAVQNGNKKFKPLTGIGSYNYRVEGVQEGMSTYDIDLTISAVNEHSAPNSYQFADLTAFSSASVAIINPVIDGTSYDSRALEYFMKMNKKLYSDRYAEQCRRIDNINRDRFDEYYSKRETDPTISMPALATYPPADDYAPLAADVVSSYVNKKVRVLINDYTKPNGEKEWILDSEIVYSCSNPIINGKPAFSEAKDADGNYIYHDNVLIERAPYNGFCHNQKYASLDTVMLIYKPFNDVTNLHNEKIEICKNAANDMNIYIAFQGDKNIDYGSVIDKPELNISGSYPTNINLYSQLKFDPSNITGAGLNASQIHHTLISDLPGGNRLYNLTVKVYEGGTSFGRLVAQIDSTMLDE